MLTQTTVLHETSGLMQHSGHDSRELEQCLAVASNYVLRTVIDQLALDLTAQQSRPDVDQKIADEEAPLVHCLSQTHADRAVRSGSTQQSSWQGSEATEFNVTVSRAFTKLLGAFVTFRTLTDQSNVAALNHPANQANGTSFLELQMALGSMQVMISKPSLA